MATMTIDQARHRVWPTREAAMKDLKRAKIAERGEDYELREFKAGSWQLMERSDDAGAPPLAAAAARVAKAVKRHAADQNHIDRIAKAQSFAVHFRVSPSKRDDATAATLAEARVIEARMNKEHGKGGRRAMVYAVVDGVSIPVPADYQPLPAEEPKVEPVKPDRPAEADMTTLPTEGGPYRLVVDIAHVDQATVAPSAYAASRRLGCPVGVMNAAGEVVRTIDRKVVDAHDKGAKSARRSSGTKGPRTGGKSAKVAEMLFRAVGATKQEIVAVTDWSFGERYIRRIAATHKAEIDTLGKDHWRLRKAA